MGSEGPWPKRLSPGPELTILTYVVVHGINVQVGVDAL